MTELRFVPLPKREYLSDELIRQRARAFEATMQRRRTVRDFSPRAVPREVIEDCLHAAGTGPSGANLQPWHFVAVSDAAKKHEIRMAAEEEEREFYENRTPAEWLEALAPLGTDSNKPFIEIAPWLIAVSRSPTEFSPMAFLNRILSRPAHEKPFLLLVVGHPATGAMVPDISRKALDAVSTFVLSSILMSINRRARRS